MFTFMPILQLACAAIVALYLIARLRRAPRPGAVLARLGLLAAASWLGEDSVIRAYHFYRYADGWWLFIDQVPLAICVIWPIVIDSAGRVAVYICTNAPPHGGSGGPPALPRWRVPLVGAALVLADASLIEPVAVRAGLWSWSEPGMFAVPPIGILGWALFAFAAFVLLGPHGHEPDAHAPSLKLTDITAVLIAPAATHLMLLAAWWGALRWVNHPLPAWPVAIIAWLVLAPLGAAAWRARLRHRIPLGDLLVRIPPALLFFVLLALHHEGAAPLVAYAFAFAPPWLALLDLRSGSR